MMVAWLRMIVPVILVQLLVSPAWGETTRADEMVTLRLQSGRKFTGQVDSRSDGTRIWLRFGRHRMTVLRPIRWERINAVWVAEEKVTVDVLHGLVQDMHVPSHEAHADQTTVGALVSKSHAMIGAADSVPYLSHGGSRDEYARSAPGRTPTTARVKNVAFDAQTANWDGDVETDGLRVHVYPMDGAGYVTPVTGVIEVILFAKKRQASHSVPRGRGQTTQRVGHWKRPIRASEFTRHGKTVQLPFQAQHPEFDTDLASHGLVHLKLVVPGQGVFENSQDGLRMRPYSPFRDALQMSGLSRFLSSERTGRGR